MSDVFISYARSSAKQAQAAAADLRASGYSVWLDDDLPSHRAYSEVIEEQLASAKAVVVIWSTEAVKSQWVRSEADRARGEGKLVQATIDGAPLPMPFDQVQCVNLAGWLGTGRHPAWPRVVAGVATLVGHIAGERGSPAPAPEAQPRLAVLPFETLSDEMQGFADGVSEEIIQTLTMSPDLKVIGRTASFQFRGALKSGAADALKASHVLDGTVRQVGDRVRVTAQLTEAATGTALWAERFDRDVSDAFALQDEIAARVVQALQQALPGGRPSPPPAAPTTAAPAGERRHLTVLACHLVRTDVAAGRLDPELRHAIAAAFQRAAAQAVTPMDGHVAKGRGDDLTVYFGYPTAREDAAERAVRAGLAIIATMPALNGRFAKAHDVTLGVRVGVAAGTVVIAKGEDGELDLFGDAPNIAAGIQAIADPDTLLMTDAVHNVVAAAFVAEDRGEAAVGDAEAPVRLFRAVRAETSSGRARGFSECEMTPFVGRQDEMQLLLNRWERVQEGEGQVVLVVGEPGIGKTRLIEEFRARIKTEPHQWIECAGAPFYANTPFHAVAQMLDQVLGRADAEDPEVRVDRLEHGLARAGLRPAESLPLIAEMLSLPVPERFAPLMISPDQRRRRLFAALAAWVFGGTTSQPLVIAMEDLHWVDPSTMELIATLVDQGATAPLMLICTTRPEFHASWPVRGHHAQITLNRLSNRQTRDLVAGVIARAGLASDLIESVITRTDGVPLFAEELTRLILESDGRRGAREIPATLLDSLTARLDRLGRAKEVAQLGSVLGREFSYELLQAVSPLREDELQANLTVLADAELIYARGAPPEARYRFKHALTQDAAYEGLLKSRRRELHALVARTIIERFPALAEAQPEVLARHWTEAGEAGPAVTAWKGAGDAAYARRAFKEAEESYRQALSMLATLPETVDRDARELEVCSALNRTLQLTRGYAAPETVEAAARARVLAEKAGSVPQLIREEARLWRAIITSGDYAGASALADHVLDLTNLEGRNPGRLVFAHNAQVQTRFYTGDLVGVEDHFERLSPLIETDGLRQAPGNNNVAIGVASLTASLMGRYETAHARAARAQAFAETTANPYDLAMALHFQGLLHTSERRPQLAEAAAARLLALAEENGFAYAGFLARVPLGWALAHRGAAAEGVDLIRQALAGMVGLGSRVGLTSLLNLLAEAQELAGAADEALATVEDALSANPQERVYRPETHYRRAALRLRRGEQDLALADFREAAALAQSTGDVTWELRAAMGQARLHTAEGKGAAARDLIVPLLPRFTDGTDTVDLEEARALLDGLDG